MFESGQRFNTRNNRHIDSHLLTLIHKVKILAVIEEHLRNNIVGTRIYLLFKTENIIFGTYGVAVSFGVSRNADTEVRAVRNAIFGIEKFATIHCRDLTHKVGCVGVSLRVGHKRRLALHSITTQSHQGIQTQEIHINQKVLDIIFGMTATDKVRNGINAIARLNRRRNTNSTRAMAVDVAFDSSVCQRCRFDKFAVEGNVNKGGRKLLQSINRLEYLLGAVAFEWREQLKRKSSSFFALRLCYYIFNLHCVSKFLKCIF